MLNRQLTTLQTAALEEYLQWLAFPFQFHVTTTLTKRFKSTLEANRHFIHSTLAPLTKHLNCKLSGLSVVVPQPPHVHTLLFTVPCQPVDTAEIDYHCLQFGLTPSLSRRVVVKPIYPDSISYVFRHLLLQSGALHFHNLKLQ